jgi:hypothetical protein
MVAHTICESVLVTGKLVAPAQWLAAVQTCLLAPAPPAGAPTTALDDGLPVATGQARRWTFLNASGAMAPWARQPRFDIRHVFSMYGGGALTRSILLAGTISWRLASLSPPRVNCKLSRVNGTFDFRTSTHSVQYCENSTAAYVPSEYHRLHILSKLIYIIYSTASFQTAN